MLKFHCLRLSGNGRSLQYEVVKCFLCIREKNFLRQIIILYSISLSEKYQEKSQRKVAFLSLRLICFGVAD